MKHINCFVLIIFTLPTMAYSMDSMSLNSTNCASADCYLNNLYTSYMPTLDVLYNQNQSPINSAYTIEFLSNGKYNRADNANANGANPAVNYVGYYLNKTKIGSYTNMMGGVLLNESTVNNIFADFINNKVDFSLAAGGAIYNKGTINNIHGDFIENKADGYAGGQGGAIYNNGEIGNIYSNFINNISYSGGAIYNDGAQTIQNIVGLFVGNKSSHSVGGAIYNRNGTIDNINADFVANQSNDGGGAIYNRIEYSYGGINNIIGNFINNSAKTNGGAIFNTGGKNTTVSGNFWGNNAKEYGGAIYTDTGMRFIANAKQYSFLDNYIGSGGTKEYNAIYSTAGLTFDITNGGAFYFADNIKLNNAGIEITGDRTGVFSTDEQIIDASAVNITNSTLKFLHSGESRFSGGAFTISSQSNTYPVVNLDNGTFDIHNNYIETINLKSLNSSNGDNYLHLDLSPDTLTSDMINISGDIYGTTNLVIHSMSNSNIAGSNIIFATSNGAGNAESFNVFRVYGSPFLYNVSYNTVENTNVWSLIMNSVANPDYETDNEDTNTDNDKTEQEKPNSSPAAPTVNPEIVAYSGIQQAVLTQQKQVANNILYVLRNLKQTPASPEYVIDEKYICRPQKSVKAFWVNPKFNKIKDTNTVNMVSEIYGTELGARLYSQDNVDIGLWGDITLGKHNFNGKSKELLSLIESDLDIYDVNIGAYFYTIKKYFSGFMAAHAGKQTIKIATDDGINAKTKSNAFGVQAKLDTPFKIAKSIYSAPGIGAKYLQINVDNIKDDFGISAEYKKLKYYEFSAGVVLKYAHDTFDILIEPEYVLTNIHAPHVNITNINTANAIEANDFWRISGGVNFKTTSWFDININGGGAWSKNYSDYKLGLAIKAIF